MCCPYTAPSFHFCVLFRFSTKYNVSKTAPTRHRDKKCVASIRLRHFVPYAWQGLCLLTLIGICYLHKSSTNILILFL